MNKLKLTLLLSSAVAVLIGYGVVAWKAYNIGQDVKEAECMSDEQEDTAEKVDIRKKQNEIRNHRPDDTITTRRLRDHSF